MKPPVVDPRAEVPPALSAGSRRVEVQRGAADAAELRAVQDWVALEEPLEIRVAGRPMAITMRTPGNDRELVLGFLLAEGVIAGLEDVVDMQLERAAESPVSPAVRASVELGESALDRWARRAVDRELRRTLTSACGVCGKPSLDDLPASLPRPRTMGWERSAVPGMLAAMRERQALFERTGGVHAAAAFDVDGVCHGVFEDVGRHNAVDKLVGASLERSPPLAERVLVVSGRAGYEIVQKALAAGAPVLVAVGAASSLAVELARGCGLELLSFAGGAALNRHL